MGGAEIKQKEDRVTETEMECERKRKTIKGAVRRQRCSMTMSNLPSIYGWRVRTWHAVNLKPDLAANSSCQGRQTKKKLTDKPACLMKTVSKHALS